MFSIIFLGLFQREQGSALLWRLSVSAVILRIRFAACNLNRPAVKHRTETYAAGQNFGGWEARRARTQRSDTFLLEDD